MEGSREMNNVTQLRTPQKKDHPDQLILQPVSPIMFTAYERPLFYDGKNGDRYSNTGHKALVRMNDSGPVCLNVVKNTYKVVQNVELFDAIDEGLRAGLGSDYRSAATVNDKISYNGTQCFREYIFPDIKVESPERDTIAFRIIVQNGFGTGAIKLYSGAIDFFCTNGLIIGDYTSTYAKHTSGLKLGRFKEAVEGSVNMFWKNRHLYGELAGKKVLSDDDVSKFYERNFGERLGARLYRQYLIETKVRGRTLWAVYSALTYYSSHVDGEFSVRNTGNDHTASTLMNREVAVMRVTQSTELMELAA
jgi:hypothetical protein